MNKEKTRNTGISEHSNKEEEKKQETTKHGAHRIKLIKKSSNFFYIKENFDSISYIILFTYASLYHPFGPKPNNRIGIL